jgi:hypothetical protein
VAQQIWLGWICESSGLTPEDSLIEHAMVEGPLHIELLNRLVAGGSNGEHLTDGGRFDNWVESLIVVHTRALCETLEDPSSLVAVKSPARETYV